MTTKNTPSIDRVLRVITDNPGIMFHDMVKLFETTTDILRRRVSKLCKQKKVLKQTDGIARRYFEMQHAIANNIPDNTGKAYDPKVPPMESDAFATKDACRMQGLLNSLMTSRSHVVM